MDNDKLVKVEFIESYIKHGNGDYQWNDNHGELIRCKDCKYGQPIVLASDGKSTLYRTFCTKPYVERGSATHIPDWYCADGERKDGDGDG